GNELRLQGRQDEALATLQRALETNPRFADIHKDIGLIRLEQGRFAEAKSSTRRCIELLPENSPILKAATEQLQRCETMVLLESRLPSLLKREASPADNAERLLIAWMCQRPVKKLFATSARFYAEAIANDARSAKETRQQHRYNAALAAALAGCGKGEDAHEL